MPTAKCSTWSMVSASRTLWRPVNSVMYRSTCLGDSLRRVPWQAHLSMDYLDSVPVGVDIAVDVLLQGILGGMVIEPRFRSLA